ncbi:MAG: copper-binding protein [Polynucleobacter sp.]
MKNLDMPPMTMIFNVKNKALLNGLKSGDQVEFVASSEGGKLYVVELKKGE